MAKNIKKGLSAFLAALMCTSTMSLAVNAAETVWQGDDAKLNIAAGEDPYVYAIAQDPVNNRWYYETSNHTVQLTGGGAVHIFPIVDTTKYSGEWTPNGIYNSGVSNYDVMYCCDATTGTDGDFYYKRVNLEDSEYVSEADAKKLRAIVENAYPYVSVEEAKAALQGAGFAQADELDRSELITATQAAIWKIANPDSGDTYYYSQTASDVKKLSWGGYLHDFSPESEKFKADNGFNGWGYKTDKDAGDRINALIDFYLNKMKGVDAKAGQIVITKLDTNNSKIAGSDDTYKVTLDVALNHGADENDDVKLNVYVNGELVESKSVAINEATEYSVDLVAKANDKIKVEVSGTQNLECGVYFYVPKPQDVDGDGIATSREVSQNLIGVASGDTPVHAEKTFTVDVVNVDLEINKVDADGQPLKGAKFAIYDEDGNLLEDQLVDENGQLVFKGLIPGTYSLKETVAPEGYLLPKEAIEVVVNSDGSVTFDGETLVGEMTTTDPVVSEGEAVNSPEVTVDLVPGEETVVTNKVVETENAAKTVIAVRDVTATMSEVIVTVGEVSYSSVVPVATAVKYTGENKNEQILLQDLYCNNTNTDSVNVTGAPEGYPFKLIGNSDKSVHFVPKLHVTYERDEAENALKDENGNYIIKSISKPNGSEATSTVLTFKGEPITDVNSLYDENCGSAPTIGAFKSEDGSVLYGYCIDVESPTNMGDWYQLANLEDNDYYATEDAENHVRNIVFNGYWGTTEGTGSLASIKAALKAALAEGKIEKEYDVTFIVKVGAYSEGYELGDGEYVYGSEVRKTVTEHVVLTDAVIDAMTEGEALDATQSAIWAYANGANFDLNGEDGVVVGNITMANSARFARAGAKNDDFEGGARAMALYNYLVSLDSDLTSTVATVINDKTFAENMSLTVGNKVSDGVYNAALSFTLGAQLTEKDDLAVVLTYVDANGEEKTIEAKLTGEGALVAENGVYTIDGLTVKENEAFSFSLNINGDQYLEKGAYILNGEKGTDKAQSMVTIGEFTSAVDVTKSASITFEVKDYAEVEFKNYKYSVDVENTPVPPTITFNSGDASNISFMLIDKDGNVEFVEKIDIGGQTSFEIPTAEGKISAVFVKQSTSGMFWASQEIDEDLQEKVIDCLKDNNPSYKGHWDEFFFGAGEFTWVPKKQSVTYTFSGDVAEIEVEIPDETLEEPVEEETVVEEAVVEQTKSNGNNKNKNKNK